MNWTPEVYLHKFPSDFTHRLFQEIIDGGQSFRWYLQSATDHSYLWQGTWARHVVQLRYDDTTKSLFYQTPSGVNLQTSEKDIRDYLCIGDRYDVMIDQLPWRSDPVLHAAMAHFPQLRILQQPFPETLLCFILSSSKQIPHIKKICLQLAENYGDPLANGHHALPTWEQLHHISEADLRALGMGYRAKFLKESAKVIVSETDFFERTQSLPYPEAHAKLTKLHGVGDKIADCALLFGGQFWESFPVDTWIAKAMQDLYQLEKFSLAQLAQFGRIHYGAHAGLAQQFLFSYYRQQKKAS